MEIINKKIIKEYLQRKENILFVCLCAIVFSASFITGNISLKNANVVYSAEIIFLVLYLIILRELPPFKNIIAENKTTFYLLVFWSISITCSFLFSPLNLTNLYVAIGRYFQTIVHIVTFIFIWDFFKRYKPDLRYLFYFIPISIIIVIYFFVTGIMSMLADSNDIEQIGKMIFAQPPFNSHIRHTGYQVTAALIVMVLSVYRKIENNYLEVINILMLTTLWAFIFWLGGRGAILSVILTTLFVWLLLSGYKTNRKGFVIKVCLSAVVGLVIAESLVIFQWNGVLSSFQRSIEADDINALSTNRITLWKTAWESFSNNPIFGLGPQGYMFMPNRVFGVQPHNILMQFLVEWGIIGTVLFIVLLAKGFWSGFNEHILGMKGRVNVVSLTAGSIILTLTIHSLVDGTYYHPQPSFYLVTAFAVWLIPEKQYKP